MNYIKEAKEKIKQMERELAWKIAKELQEKDYFTKKEFEEVSQGELSLFNFGKYVKLENVYDTTINEISIDDLCCIAHQDANDEYYTGSCSYDYKYVDGKIIETITDWDTIAGYRIKKKGEKNGED